MQQPAKATVNAAGTGDAAIETARPGLTLLGYSVRETAGAVARFNLHNGDANSDPIVARCALAADAEKTVWLGPQGIACPDGIFLDRTAGSTEITVYSTP